MPPMMTDSKANNKSNGPSEGDTVVRMPCRVPEMEMSTKANPVAEAYTCRAFNPMSSAISGSSETALKALPIWVFLNNHCKKNVANNANTKINIGSKPIDMDSEIANPRVLKPSDSMALGSAEKISSKKF